MKIVNYDKDQPLSLQWAFPQRKRMVFGPMAGCASDLMPRESLGLTTSDHAAARPRRTCHRKLESLCQSPRSFT